MFKGCFNVQINDQVREFVNQVCDKLHKLTGVEQRVTFAYHPQPNQLLKCQNWTIKNSLVKVLEDNHEMLLNIIDGIVFAHCVSRHSSTKYSTFMMLYKCEPVLNMDVKYWALVKTWTEKKKAKLEVKTKNHLF